MDNSKNSFNKFLLLWSGEFISAIGSGLTSFGLGVYIFQQTNSASATALVTLFAFMPGLLLSPVAGVLADRYDRRVLMMLGDGLSALGLLFILICMLLGNVKLWQICAGVTISSIFSSLLEPAYKATVTDLLDEKQYTRASALVQLAGSAKYLISPALAAVLLAVGDIKLLLLIDMGTIVVTIVSTLVVKKGLVSKEIKQTKSFIFEFKEGWQSISKNKGVFILVIVTSIMTFFLGFIQTLSTPMVLAFSNSSTLGIVMTIISSGMLISSVVMGMFPIKKSYFKILCVSLFGAGIFMAMFGLRENRVLICVAGFLFFMMLPLINTSLDYLVRINIDDSVQGRAWGFIGIISQFGFVLAYLVSGVLADYVFTPLLANGGTFAANINKIIGTGSGRGAGFLILVAGILLSMTAIILYQLKSVKNLENKILATRSE